MSLTLKAKVLFISVAVLCTAIGANTLFGSILFRRAYTEALKERTFVIGETLKSELEKPLESGTPIDQIKGFDVKCRELVARYSDISYAMVVDLNGKILFHDTPSNRDQVITDLNILMEIDRLENTSRIYSGAGEALYDFMIPVFGLNGDHVAAVRVGFPVGLISQRTGSLIIRTVGSSLFFFGLGTLLLIIFTSFWVARPLAELVALIQDTGNDASGLVQTSEIESSDELELVTRAFRQIKREIIAADEKIRKYSRDLEMEARERTPKLRKSYERLKQYITERKGMEESLWRLQKKYQTILESIEDGYYESDLKWNLTFFNDSLCRILGYPRNELVGMNTGQFSDKKTANRVSQAIEKVTLTGKPAKALHFEIIKKDGIRRQLEASVSVVKDSEDQPIGLRGIIRDITARRWMEKELRESEKRYRTILESIEDGYYEVNIAGNFIFFNEALCRMLGYTGDELMGMNNRDYMSPEESKRAYKIFKNIYQTGKSIRVVNWKIFRKDGSIIHIESSASLIRNSRGKPSGFRGIARDITEGKKMEEVVEIEPVPRGKVL
ncbi:MAG: PAS domain S-box protein [Deltaproteobacteria bacterium]|nr:PAS domain S-box protein [Deltaproteobacteria bacterium]